MVLKKVGLFFGSFNPVHQGHLIIASYLRQIAGLDEAWFVISPQNPFKNKSSLLNEYERLHLVNLAIENNFSLKSCDIEFYLPKPSYTIDTLTHLKEKYPSYDFSLIMGEDNLKTFHLWKNYQSILQNHRILVYKRADLSPSLNINTPEWNNNVKVFSVPLLDISATFIRENIRKGISMEYFLPPKVYEYITEMNLYK